MTTGTRERRSVPLTVHRLLDSPLVGTRLPSLVLEGWAAGDDDLRSHAVPAPGARWTLLLLERADRSEVDEHRGRLAAEAVTAVVVAGAPRASAAVLVDPAGVIQHVADGVEDALDVVAAFRTGGRRPVGADQARALRRCPAEGRRRRGSVSRFAGRRRAV